MVELTQWLSIEPFSWASVGTCILCGTLVGFERQLRGKPVGILTASLIVLGTYIFMAITMAFFMDNANPTRIIGQIVTGIGFLGAGVMLSKDGVILGVTSAATIWVLAAIGIIIPVAGNLPAIKMALVVLGVLVVVNRLESASTALTRGVHASYNTWRSSENRPSWFKQRYSERGAKNRISEDN